MTYEAEFAFFRHMIDQLHLPSHVGEGDLSLFLEVDGGLRTSLGYEYRHTAEWFRFLKESLHGNAIFRIRDEFCRHYIVLFLPETEPLKVFVVGPYVTEEMTDERLADFCEQHGIRSQWIPVLKSHFQSVSRIQGKELLTAALSTLGDCLWGPQQYSVEEISDGMPEFWMPLSGEPGTVPQKDVLSEIRTIEARYESENRLIQVISQGRSHRAKMMLSSFSQSALEQRSADPSRNIKNYTIILNTLMRKGVEMGGVHPLYIDRVSSEFAHRIERLSGGNNFAELWQEMAHKYCLLVKKHATGNYSPLVQKVIARVDFDLTADLSLKASAQALSVNASYLSTVFKKEVGVTLTEYVNRRRMEHAAFLLNSTKLSVSAVGLYCGIQDDNYFAKMFKKYTGKTPKQFRQESSHFPAESSLGG